MTVNSPKDLSSEDLIAVFRRVTNGFAGSRSRWKQRAVLGLTDEELWKALELEIGVYGGGGGPGEMSFEHQRADLKIWASWNDVAPFSDQEPVFQGTATVRMAREVYGIGDPGGEQLSLL